MDPDFARRYRELHERHWWWRARRRIVLAAVRALVPPGGFGHVLDVGCGDGLFFDDLAPFGALRGVEPDPAAVSADGPYRDRIHAGPFDASFSAEEPFGLVLMLDVLEHLEDPVAALARARALLATGGRVLITVPASRALWTGHDRISHHLRRYTRATLRAQCEAAGLTVAGSRYFFHWLAPVKLLIRARERVLPAPPRTPRVPGALLNGSCYWLSRAEELTLGRLRLPFGSSLLAIARPR